jgi:hypothetical protein
MNRMYCRFVLALTAFGLMILVPPVRSARTTAATTGATSGIQQTDCTMYTLTPTSQSFSAAGGSGSVFVDTGPGGGHCMWHAKSPDGWITPDGSNLEGDKALSYTVAVNNSFPRNGTIQILSVPGDALVATFSVSQDGVSGPGAMTVCAADVPVTSTGGAATSTIIIDHDLLVDHVSVSLYFTVPRVGGLGPGVNCTLTTPGDSILLFSGGFCSSTFGSPCVYRLLGDRMGSSCPNPDCVFDGYARTSIYKASPPYVGQFREDAGFGRGLIGLDRTNARGTWTLHFDGGTVQCWCLRFDLARPGLKLLPVRAQAPIFFPHTVSAFLASQGGTPVANQPVSFVVRGDHDEVRLTEIINTDASGIARLQYYDFAPGDNLIEATATIGGVQTGDVAQVTWLSSGLSGLEPTKFCPIFSAAAGKPGAEATLDAAHGFRDTVLLRTPRGQQYTRLYYQFSSEAVRLMMFNPMLLIRSQAMLERYQPTIQSLASGKAVTLASSDLDEIDDFLGAFERKGSPELQSAISSLRRDLRDPKVHSDLSIEIAEGPHGEKAAQSSQALGSLLKRAVVSSTTLSLCFFSCVVAIRLTRKKRIRAKIKHHFCLTLGLFLCSHLTVIGGGALYDPRQAMTGLERRTALAGTVSGGDGSDAPTRAPAKGVYGKLPLTFEPNRGQSDPQVKFLSRGIGHNIFLTPSEAVLSLKGNEPVDNCRKPEAEIADQVHPLPAASHPPSHTIALRMKLLGANPNSEMFSLDQAAGTSNYFVGSDPAKWRTGLPASAQVKDRDIYPGIDAVYYGNQQQLETDFLVAPGADPGAIRLEFEGGNDLSLDSSGDLVLGTAAGEIRERKPVAYQEVSGGRRIIPCRYTLYEGQAESKDREPSPEPENRGRQTRRVGFDVGPYDPTKLLVIDPLMAYSTYLGGSGDDEGTAITVDPAGNAYVVGFTDSTNFPTTAVSQSALGGGLQDAFVAKLNPSGTALVYSTYLGGNGQDNASAVAVDSAGNAYVTGFTGSTDFPVKNAMQPAKNGRFNAFVAKLNPAGSLLFSTLLGGSVGDYGSSIAVDQSGSVYIAGVATSPNFPMVNAVQPTFGGGTDVYVAKLSPSGASLVYSTYLGGSGNDGATGITIDSAGNLYVTGVTTSTDFHTANPLQATHGGGLFDAFVAKLNPSGNQLVYSTYLGGSGEDRGFRIAADAAGNAYVTGDTNSTDFPTANASQKSDGGGVDAFVAKLNPSGSQLVYSTYVGGSGIDCGTAVAVDSAGSAFVTGFTSSLDFPTANPLQQSYGGGAFDAFIAVLDPSGASLIYSTYLGADGIDAGLGVAVDASENAYIMGESDSVNFPTVNPLQPAFGGGASDLFVAKMRIGPLITAAQVVGKKLLVTGIGFHDGAKILLNGDPQKTANDDQNPASALVAKKAGKLIALGQTVTLQVQDSDATLSPEFRFTRQ